MLIRVLRAVAARRTRADRAAFVSLLLLLTSGSVRSANERSGDATPAKAEPRVEHAPPDLAAVAKRIKAPEGLEVSLFASEPLLANPVSFCIDERNRFFVAETFRLHAGVTDNRDHAYWVDDDLASRTVADRVAMYRRHLKEQFDTYAREQDRVRRVEDTDGDGVADRTTVLVDGFSNAEDGIGAGLLARKGKVYFACVPDLWLVEDKDDDGKADTQRSLHSGYGVHVGFLGHDLHGLKMGPDGRLYFTMGDRGLHVDTAGKTLALPDSGAVLRCWPDGSELELFATGLRNPQELAFDELGNLFTVDNNSDAGDRARLVHLVPGGDSGWRFGYQFILRPVARGPWNAEKLWDASGNSAVAPTSSINPAIALNLSATIGLAPAGESAKAVTAIGPAAYRLPPLANLSDGPSGLAYYPGTGFGDRFAKTFFLCDFRGTYGTSGVRTFEVEPKGATFTLVKQDRAIWSILATDVDFGIDGALYVLDWVDGWAKTGRGRIFRIRDPKFDADPVRLEVQRLLSGGLGQASTEELIGYLAHPDMRVRQEAQFALAERGSEAIAPLAERARRADPLLARVHALWGLGQIARVDATAGTVVLELLSDKEGPVRGQAAKVAGELRLASASAALIGLLADPEPTVRFQSAIALGRLGEPEALGPLLEVLRANADQDAYLRHGAVMGLVGAGDPDRLMAAASDSDRSVRLGVLLALRRFEDPRVARFLEDPDPDLVLEAARAINDVPISAAMPGLAALASRPELSGPLARRVLNANYRLGQAEGAAAVAHLAARDDLPREVRAEALEALRDWAMPSGRDRVMGLWRPIRERPAAEAAAALAPLAPKLIEESPDKLAESVMDAVGVLGIREATAPLIARLQDTGRPTPVRAAAIRALGRLEAPELSELLPEAAKDTNSAVRTEARRLLAKFRPADAAGLLAPVLETGSIEERQAAIAILADVPEPSADQVLLSWLDRLERGEVPPEIELDLLEAVARRPGEPFGALRKRLEAARHADDPVARYRETLVGGDADLGKKVFFERAEVSCLRCHKLKGRGGEVGPDLTHVGQQKRDYLLEALVAPDRQIAKGYDSVVLTTVDGSIHSGVLKEEDAQTVRLMTPDGRTVSIAKEDIEERVRGKSAMPEDVTKSLSKMDLRNLIEYLATLK